MWLDKLMRALFGAKEPAQSIGPETSSGASVLGDMHQQVAAAFGASALELTEMWKHEVRLNPTMARFAAGADSLARPSASASRDWWLVTKPNDTEVLGVVGRYAEPGKRPKWVGTDTQGRLQWQSVEGVSAVMQRGGWPDQ